MFLKISHRSDKKKESLTKLSDEKLIAYFRKKNDPEVVGVLFERYIHLVFGVCLKYLQDQDKARDTSMEIFEKLFEYLPKYNIEQFPSWLHTVSKNFCLMKQREKTRILFEQEISKKYEYNKIVESDTGLHLYIEREKQLDELETGLGQLKREQELCIRLFYLQDMSYQDIATNLGLDIKQVKSYIQNGKRNLKNIILKSKKRAKRDKPLFMNYLSEHDEYQK